MNIKKNVRDWEDYFQVPEENRLSEEQIKIIEEINSNQLFLSYFKITKYFRDENGNITILD